MIGTKCKNCGAIRGQDSLYCPYCDNELPQTDLSAEQRQQLEVLLCGWNEPFTRLNRQAEDRGVSIMFAGLGVTILLAIGLRVWAAWGWLALIAFVIAGFILAVAISIGVGDRLSQHDAQQLYERQIQPQIEAYLDDTNISRWQLLEIAQATLQRHKPLRHYLLADADVLD